MSDALGWSAIVLSAATVFALRFAGFWIVAQLGMTSATERFLDKLSLSVLVAIVATALSSGGAREIAAVAAAMVAMVIGKNALVAMSAAMGLAALWAFVGL